MSQRNVFLLVLMAALLALSTACPYAAQGRAGTKDLPDGHPKILASPSRKLLAQSALDPSYQTAMRALIDDFMKSIGKCQFSQEGMKYADPDALIPVNSASVFFPAGSWLRAFFHDAGTFIKSPSASGPKGGPNGSLGVGCTITSCGKQGTATVPLPGAKCPNDLDPVSGFSDGNSYCCPKADECIAHGQSPNSSPTPGLTVPVCLKGSPETVELCRRENDNLLPTIQTFRARQADPAFQWTGPDGAKKPLSLADIIVAGAVVAVQQCSGQALNITHTFGRPDATLADDQMLPSPGSIIEDKHFSVFQQMGLNKVDMVTMVTGSHAIGGFRAFSSPGLTTCPYVPFDCTPAGQIAAAPFDNNVFKVACDGVRGVSKGRCAFNDICTNPSMDETAGGCPFTGPARAAYKDCNATSYPAPGLISDVFLCHQPNTQARMVNYAQSQEFFFAAYGQLFAKLASLGYQASDLVPQNW